MATGNYAILSIKYLKRNKGLQCYLSFFMNFFRRIKLQIYKVKFLREMRFIYFSNSVDEASASMNAFSTENSKYWKDTIPSDSDKIILIEGLLSSYGVNYLLRTGMVAKAIEERTHFSPMVLFDDYTFKSTETTIGYKSFKIEKFIYLKSFFFSNLWNKICSSILAFYTVRKISNGAKLLNLQYRGIQIGDLIYDDIIKNVSSVYTIDVVDSRYFHFFKEAFYYFGMYNNVLKSGKVKYLVSTHTVYIKYGILARLAMYHGAQVFETNDVHLLHYSKFDPKYNKFSPSYLEGINEWIRAKFSTLDFNSEKAKWVEHYLNNRFLGNFNQLDINLAFKNKKVYNEIELREFLGIKNSYPVVFILAHAFSDAPHLGKFMIFRDYYDWLTQTLEFIKNIKNVNWVFKPHPSAKLYGEEGVVETLVKEANCNHIFLTPKDFSTSSLKEIASAILTTQGTAGLEFSCFGIPVIITGRPLYAGFGFTNEPKSKEEYFYLLSNIHNIKKLTENQTQDARKVYFLYEEFSLVVNDLIDMDLLKKIWGLDEYADKSDTYYIVANNLAKSNPVNQRLYRKVLANLDILQ